jgi:hypothetical protein
MQKTMFTSKRATFISIILLLSIIATSISYAAVFNVYTVVCAPSWYCTAYDHGDCGTRTCVDVNGCGSNNNKPSEYIACAETPSEGSNSGRGGSGGGAYTGPIIGDFPEGYFTLNTDNIKVSIEQGIVVQKIILVNSSKPADYYLDIQYPSAYTRGTEFVSTTSNTRYIENSGDFNLIIDSRDILIGTYVIPIKIYNKDYSKTIGLTIDVIPADNPDIEISLDSKIKSLGVDKEILTFIKVKGLETDDNTTIIYSIIDPKGNVIATDSQKVDDISRVEHSIALPASLGEGYYALSAKIVQKSKEYVKSESFTILTPNKYLPITEIPRKNLTLWIWIVIIIASAVTLFNTGLFYKASYAPTRRKISRKINMWKYANSNSASPSIGIGEKIKRFMESHKEEKTVLDTTQRLELLKKSYERGFISLKEYHDIAKRYGYNIGVSTAQAENLSDKEKVESIMKRAEENKYHTEKEQKEEYKEEKVKEEKKIPISLSNAINIPIQKEHDNIPKEIIKKVEETVHQPERTKIEPVIEEKKSVLEAPEAERPATGNTIGGSIAHMFAQSILDKKANHDQAFFMNNHERLYCMRDLLNALPEMNQHTFEHHTVYGRNDFANWIGDVFHYYDVAEEVRNVKDKEALIDLLKRYE